MSRSDVRVEPETEQSSPPLAPSLEEYAVPIARYIFGGEILHYARKFCSALRGYKHPVITLLRVLATKPPWSLMTRDGRKVTIDGLSSAQVQGYQSLAAPYHRLEWTCAETGRRVVMTVPLGMGAVEDVFERGEYDWLPVTNRVVLDIGANVGDSSLYFWARGARRVVGYEPYPSAVRVAMAQVELNQASSAVQLFIGGVGHRRTVLLPADYPPYGASDVSHTHSNGQPVQISPLAELISRHSLTDAVLKMDCEGAEYETILDASIADLRRFSHALVEYHYGWRALETRFRDAGFHVIHTKPRFVLNPHAQRPFTLRGYLYCTRLGETAASGNDLL